jgi:hypothetical protein
MTSRLLLSLLLTAPLLRADFDPVHWRFRRQITVDSQRPVAGFPIDPVLYRGLTRDQADLRIVRGGVEIPYVITTLSDQSSETELHPAILNQGVVPGVGIEVTLELDHPVRHNRLRIATPEKNFRQRVRIETSDDSQHWTIVRDDGYIFDFSQDGRRVSVLTVDFAVSTKRYVRATVFGWKDIHSIESAWLTDYIDRPAIRDTMAIIQPARAIDLGSPGLPYNQIRFVIGLGFFHRAAAIETSDNGQTWSTAGTGVLSRTQDDEQLTIDFPEQRERFVRAHIYNGDDQPLPVESLRLAAFRRTVAFPANQPGVYWVYYGNSNARQPSYDFGYVAAQPIALGATLGPELANLAYRAPRKPWTDEHPGLLYSILGAAVLVMGTVSFRFLRKVT